MMLQYDPFANGTMGQYSNVWTTTVLGAAGGLTNPLRVDNAVAYISPSFGGFTVTGAFSNNADGADSTSNNAQNNTVYAIKGDYAGGAFTAGANYHAIQAGTSLAAVKNIQNFTLGLGYDFKFMKLTGVYSWNEIDYRSRSQQRNAQQLAARRFRTVRQVDRQGFVHLLRWQHKLPVAMHSNWPSVSITPCRSAPTSTRPTRGSTTATRA